MDFKQDKLTKYEWDSVEIPILEEEKTVLNMIMNGYNNVNICINNHLSIMSYLKIQYDNSIEIYFYNIYFSPIINDLTKMYNLKEYVKNDVLIKLKSIDKLRLEKADKNKLNNNNIYELLLLKYISDFLSYLNKYKKEINDRNDRNEYLINYEIEIAYNIYALNNLMENTIINVNKYVIIFIKNVLDDMKQYYESFYIYRIVINSHYIIEKNNDLLKYSDLKLYSHQKELFALFNKNNEYFVSNPKFVLYVAPTGTGKTLTPLALANQYKIIFVCAARHVGLALARAAISMKRKIAFAFCCETADDIRLHYSATAAYKETDGNKKSYKKIDNSVGTNVEIMICDIKSYLCAMNYMILFNKRESIITYWDEPTITMDYDKHEIHEYIQHNWSKNTIPNMILSSATLPKLDDIKCVINDFTEKYSNLIVKEICSYECKKSIPIIDNNGMVVLPHNLCENYNDIIKMTKYCMNNKTLLRYFDIVGVSSFIKYINDNPDYLINDTLLLKNVDMFDDLKNITMNSIKIYYLMLITKIKENLWKNVYEYFCKNREIYINKNDSDMFGNRSKSMNDILTNDVGAYITTKDSYTLTDGPTIFITNDVKKVGMFCIQQSNISDTIMKKIKENIEYNNKLLEQINKLKKEVDNKTSEKDNDKSSSYSAKDCKKFNREFNLEQLDNSKKNNVNKINDEIQDIYSKMKSISLNNIYIPNKQEHFDKWTKIFLSDKKYNNIQKLKSFTSNIDDCIIKDIMMINDLDDFLKILLLMGIGVFMNSNSDIYNNTYMEIIKKLVSEQKLYLIIADSDYIYGTNYQLCHGYLSKDLSKNITQEKIIQALGRIGRNKLQQTYTARFRDNELFKLLFSENDVDKSIEIINMNKLLTTLENDIYLRNLL